MPVQTRSQSRLANATIFEESHLPDTTITYPMNSKGYPSVGCLTIRLPQKNPYNKNFVTAICCNGDVKVGFANNMFNHHQKYNVVYGNPPFGLK